MAAKVFAELGWDTSLAIRLEFYEIMACFSGSVHNGAEMASCLQLYEGNVIMLNISVEGSSE